MADPDSDLWLNICANIVVNVVVSVAASLGFLFIILMYKWLLL